ncbi:MAG: hypothetical protein MOGMAGMI_00457 [Candidatus Omnitrophica bacterium]|nr:hypothetical protein [Candidatus Omnitrophota bacterium]
MNEPLLNLVVWSLGAYIVFAMIPYRRMPTCGMPLMYLFVLYLNHWFGAAIHCLPWHATATYDFVYLGFEQSFIGILSLIGGVALGSFVSAAMIGRVQSAKVRTLSNPMVVEAYVLTGLVFFLSQPVLSRIPSVRTFSSAGWSLLVAGVCLATWRAALAGSRLSILRWLAVSSLFPAYSLIGDGFLSFGIAALSVIFVFVAVFYRPKWQVALLSLVSIYMGLSLFVTYMRDRGDIRAEVWYGESSLSTSATKAFEMLSNFEFFDPYDENHLYRVDLRLNQNELVGRSVDLIRSGVVPSGRGETLIMAVAAMVPRIIWRDKPVEAGSGDIVSRYTGLIFAQGTSVGVGQVMEFYINFGNVGVFVGFLFFGLILRVFDVVAATHLRRGDWTGFIFWFVPGMGMLQAGGSMVEVTSTVISSIIFCVIINNYLLPWFVNMRMRSSGRRSIGRAAP